MLIFASLVVAFCWAWSASAAPANPAGHVYTQPDGSLTPTIFLNGNQHYAWLSDAKGYTVLKDEQGWYVYGKKEQGDIVSAGLRVGHANPKKLGLVPTLQHDDALRRGLVHEHETEHRKLIAVPEKTLCNFQGSSQNPCKLKGLVVLVRFKNHANRVLPSPSEYDILFNNKGPTQDATAPTGSVADVYLENSYDTFVMQAVVSDWIPISKTEAEAVDGNLGLNRPGTQAAWKEAVTMAKDQFGSYKQFDADGDGAFDLLVIMHSGTAAECGGIDIETRGDYSTRIWSHATSTPWYSDTDVKVGRFYVASGVWDITTLSKTPYTKWGIARIAVIAHECAHFLGLPDLYDTVGGAGIGTWCLMANMWGWYGDQLYPPLMSAWAKMQLGWVNVVNVLAAETNVKILAACEGDTIYKIAYNMKPGEFFLVENRYPCGYDAKLAHHLDSPNKDRSGIAIWHIDESDVLGVGVIGYQTEGVCGGGTCRIHYRVALVQGDGNFDMERNVNKGDRTDAFRQRPVSDTLGATQAYKIDNNGVYLNSGVVLPEPNTKGYAGATEYPTGISIEVGPQEKNMILIIKLAGATGTNSEGSTAKIVAAAPTSAPTTVAVTPFPTKSPTPPPTVAATRSPTNSPTPFPTVAPTYFPSLAPTPPPTVAPTSSPSFAPTSPPTAAPLPPPTATTIQPLYAGCTQLDQVRIAGYGCPSTLSFVKTCNNLPTMTFLFTGVGISPTKWKTQVCSFIGRNNMNKFCPLIDYSKTDATGRNHPFVYQTCQKQCYTRSQCPV